MIAEISRHLGNLHDVRSKCLRDSMVIKVKKYNAICYRSKFHFFCYEQMDVSLLISSLAFHWWENFVKYLLKFIHYKRNKVFFLRKRYFGFVFKLSSCIEPSIRSGLEWDSNLLLMSQTWLPVVSSKPFQKARKKNSLIFQYCLHHLKLRMF